MGPVGALVCACVSSEEVGFDFPHDEYVASLASLQGITQYGAQQMWNVEYICVLIF